MNNNYLIINPARQKIFGLSKMTFGLVHNSKL